jgi:hypothetical protein
MFLLLCRPQDAIGRRLRFQAARLDRSDAGLKKEKANFGSLGRLNITSPEIKAECRISGEMDPYAAVHLIHFRVLVASGG